jgi:hypothetical protein
MGFLWGVTVGLIMGALFFGSMVNVGWRTDTVNRGLAIYCPTNGQWAWVGDCK